MTLRKPNRLRSKKAKWYMYYGPYDNDKILMPDRKKQIDHLKLEMKSIEE